jgi:hypothetical protein
LLTTKPQTLKPSQPTEAAEGKQQQQHQDHDQRVLRHATCQKHPYPCDCDRVQRSRTWSPRETSPYPLPPARAPPEKGLFFHKLAHCEWSRHNELVIILKYSKEFNLPESLEVSAWSQAAFLGSLFVWLGLALLAWLAKGAASDATVRDKKNSLTWEKTKHEVTRNTIGCATSVEENQHVATLHHADHSSNGSRTSYH